MSASLFWVEKNSLAKMFYQIKEMKEMKRNERSYIDIYAIHSTITAQPFWAIAHDRNR